MRQHNLIEAGWTFGFNDNKRRAGVCRYTPKSIELSRHYCENNPDEKIKDTILHEIAHALLPPGNGHNRVWKAKCIEVGAKPERCYDDTVVMPKGNWVGRCPNCQHVLRRHRRPKNLTGWYHKMCGRLLGSFNYVWEGS